MEKDQLARQFDKLLSGIEDSARLEYTRKSPLLVAFVNEAIGSRPDLQRLLGGQPFELLQENHTNHANFMGAMFALRSGLGLVDTVIWVYKAYPGRGVSVDYFPLALNAWLEAVKKYVARELAGNICDIYQAMIDNHGMFLELAATTPDEVSIEESQNELVTENIGYLLEPDMKKALELAGRHMKTAEDVGDWWIKVAQPSLWKIGDLWEQGAISVGQEHLATSITQRVMSAFYSMILELPRPKGSVALAATPGELHEIGARMVADLLEIDGWDVYYTGANTPMESLVDLLRTHKSRYLLLSTTLISHLAKVIDLIRVIRSSDLDPRPHILVGGRAYLSDPQLWKTVFADAVADSADSAGVILNQWAKG